jgi:hypothetical protein
MVTELPDGCFDGCSNLTEVTIPSSVTVLSVGCFAECSNLTDVTIPSSVTALEKGCFAGCSKLTEVTIFSSVTVLGEYCFLGCSYLLPPELSARGADPGEILAFLKESCKKRGFAFLTSLKRAHSNYYDHSGDPCGAIRRIIMEFAGLSPARD